MQSNYHSQINQIRGVENTLISELAVQREIFRVIKKRQTLFLDKKHIFDQTEVSDTDLALGDRITRKSLP